MQTKRNPIKNSSPDPAPEPKNGGRFKKEEHLKKRAEITRVFKKGRAVACSNTRLFFLANELPCNRIVITFVRKYGNAVQRNRARRLRREAYRLLKDELTSGYDVVLLVYPRAEGTIRKEGFTGRETLAEIRGQLEILFKKAGITRREVQ